MKIALISGSHRPTGNSGRIARHIQKEAEAKGNSTYVLDLAQTDLPFWDEGLWGAEGLSAKWEKVWNPVKAELESADAFVVVCPEYHGMVPSKLTNLFLLFGNGPTVAHKPALAVTVSSSMGGAYPLEELRAVTTKNNRMVYLPEHLIVRNADNMFIPNPPEEHAKSNAFLTERLDWTLDMLAAYGKALATVRSTVQTTHPKFANGM
ncbi:MAG: NADPH-dependent oxidoreductase [Verrucomicrobiaceae bacterium]|nr:MAG: NADPH-dependent oxidoreductase [Verrucomicrobiaceae bacterium]